MKDIKLTNGEIRKIVDLLASEDSLINTHDTTRSFPMVILWRIQTNYNILKPIYDQYIEAENKIRGEYFTEEKTNPQIVNGEPSGQYELKPQYRQEFFVKLIELANIENEVRVDTISFESVESRELTGSELQSIRFMIDDPVEKTESE